MPRSRLPAGRLLSLGANGVPEGQAISAHPLIGRIAQLVEQLTLNQRVQGSSPCAPTSLRPRSCEGCRAVARKAKAGQCFGALRLGKPKACWDETNFEQRLGRQSAQAAQTREPAAFGAVQPDARYGVT